MVMPPFEAEFALQCCKPNGITGISFLFANLIIFETSSVDLDTILHQEYLQEYARIRHSDALNESLLML